MALRERSGIYREMIYPSVDANPNIQITSCQEHHMFATSDPHLFWFIFDIYLLIYEWATTRRPEVLNHCLKWPHQHVVNVWQNLFVIIPFLSSLRFFSAFLYVVTRKYCIKLPSPPPPFFFSLCSMHNVISTYPSFSPSGWPCTWLPSLPLSPCFLRPLHLPLSSRLLPVPHIPVSPSPLYPPISLGSSLPSTHPSSPTTSFTIRCGCRDSSFPAQSSQTDKYLLKTPASLKTWRRVTFPWPINKCKYTSKRWGSECMYIYVCMHLCGWVKFHTCKCKKKRK